MKKIGVLFGTENSFPGALVETINGRNIEGLRAEFLVTGAAFLEKPAGYAVIVDRISHDVPFYRALLKQAALNGTAVINNPFWASADDKFLNVALAKRLGVAVPATVILPHKLLPPGTVDRTMRNLEFPLDWESVFAYVGEHGFLKPVDGGGWRDVHEVHGREEFFRAYDATRDLCMMYQKAVEYTAYFRCYVVGQKHVRVMEYDPKKPHAERYEKEPAAGDRKLLRRMERDAVKLCKALGYDVNSVEFAVKDDVPYAIDFMNPVPDADVHTVGAEHFEWLVERVAELAIAKALSGPAELEARWAALLGAETAAPEKKKVGGKKSAAKAAAEKKAKAAAPRLKARAEKKVKSAKAGADAEAIAEMAAAVEAATPVEETRAEAAEETELKAIAATEDGEIVE
jgi:hypothetical protein